MTLGGTKNELLMSFCYIYVADLLGIFNFCYKDKKSYMHYESNYDSRLNVQLFKDNLGILGLATLF